jgi:hypothetical protein
VVFFNASTSIIVLAVVQVRVPLFPVAVQQLTDVWALVIIDHCKLGMLAFTHLFFFFLHLSLTNTSFTQLKSRETQLAPSGPLSLAFLLLPWLQD